MRKHFHPSTIVATVALVFALAGTSYAASTYLITSTNQITPSVLKTLRASADRAEEWAPRARPD